MNIKKISVRFNLDKETDSKAWHYLRSVKGQSYTETVINIAVCERIEQKKPEIDEKLQDIKEIYQPTRNKNYERSR